MAKTLDKFTEQAIRSLEETSRTSPEETRAARIAAEKAAEAVTNDRAARDADLQEVLKEAISRGGQALRPVIRDVMVRASSGCDGAVCGVGCGVGCGGGCLIVGGATVGFGAAGGTTGGAGTTIALS